MLERFPASRFIQMALDTLNMTASELSTLSGVSKKVISEILNNKIGYSNKIDHKIAPVLGFDIGILCQIEAKYLEYQYWYNPSYKSIFDSDWCFRKEQNLNHEKAINLLKNADKFIYEYDIKNTNNINANISIKNFLFNYLTANLNSSHNLKNDLSDLFAILPKNIKLIKFNNVNIRGMCKQHNQIYYICINTSINNTIQKFYKTFIHELLHFIDDDFLEQYNIKISNHNEGKEQEQIIDDIAHDIMLNHKKNILDKIAINNSLQISLFSKKLDINYHMLKGYCDFHNKNFKLDETDKIFYKEDYWCEIK